MSPFQLPPRYFSRGDDIKARNIFGAASMMGAVRFYYYDELATRDIRRRATRGNQQWQPCRQASARAGLAIICCSFVT